MMAGSKRELKRGRGFRRAVTLLERDIRVVGESRGFAVSRLLTHWTEVAGPALAAKTRPVKVSYAKGGFGATLTVLTTGAEAPMVEMQAEKLRDRVNACYGYAAVSRIRVTQTAPTGFAEGQVALSPPAPAQKPGGPAPEIRKKARETASDVGDPGLRAALETLGANVLSRSRKDTGTP